MPDLTPAQARRLAMEQADTAPDKDGDVPPTCRARPTRPPSSAALRAVPPAFRALRALLAGARRAR